ncbi:MAG: hypothetical protein H0U81_09355, partial [Pyrinomonadaceae bacterium]|nr:hypothetical protein [Pyrinomonadaceae bacterium]
QKDQKAREETAKLFIGMAFAFVPGSKDVIGEVALEGGDFLGKLADKAINYTWEKGKGMLESNAQNLINGQLRALNDGDALKNIDKILDAMRGTMVTINAAMPNGEEGELDLRSKFQAAFAFYNLLLQK